MHEEQETLLICEVLLLSLLNLKIKNLLHYQLQQLDHLSYLSLRLPMNHSLLDTLPASLRLMLKEINLCSRLQQRVMKFLKSLLILLIRQWVTMTNNNNLPMAGR
jgi:hypothetical protein